jgi:protein gp37
MNKQGENGIGWCDFSWNPIVGCSAISEGCDNCYAEAVARRFLLPWGKAFFQPERLNQPAKVKMPSRIFVCSMSDLGGASVVAQHAVGKAMQAAPWHQYIVLTKRPKTLSFDVLPVGTWLGVTAENQARANERIPQLLRIPAAVRFVSVEPMLGPVDLADAAGVTYWDDPSAGISWVIAGPETGPKARPCDPAWIDALGDQCAAAGVPVYDKRKGAARKEFPEARAR